MRKTFFYLPIVLLLCGLTSCGNRKTHTMSPVFDSAAAATEYDLPDIENAGELIAVTISGPETYYQYHGKDLGLQYALAENFANSLGLRLRMETVQDTVELDSMLRHAKADLVAYPLSQNIVKSWDAVAAGARWDGTTNGQKGQATSWVVRKNSPLLAEALREWFKPNLIAAARKEQKEVLSTPLVHRHVRAVVMSRSKGVISPYDHLFARYGAQGGWDWRLLAAMSYQESGFDPQATSWAGAKGLMQIMPATASHLGVPLSELTNPETNIAAAVRYLNQLNNHFRDIRNPIERQKFVIAAYNGGLHHIRDAMRLAQKNHRNPQAWDAVSYYVLHLSEARFYRDPVVRNGYMIGTETYHYVYNILDRYMEYSGIAHAPSATAGNLHYMPEKATKRNRFSRPNRIMTPRDSMFNINGGTP